MARSLQDVEEDLALAYEARRAAMKSHKYSVNNGNSGRSFERQELAAINATIIQLENEANSIRSGNPGVRIRGTVVST